MLSNRGAGEDSWESLGQQGDQTVYPKGNQLWIFMKNSCRSWSSNTLAIWCEEPSHWKRGGATEDEMVGWRHRLSGHEFEQTPGGSKDREAGCAAVHGLQSRTWLSNWKTASHINQSPTQGAWGIQLGTSKIPSSEACNLFWLNK